MLSTNPARSATHDADEPSRVRAHAENTPSALRIGYQKSSTRITLFKTRGTPEQSLAPLGPRASRHESNARPGYHVHAVVAQNFGERQKIADTFLAAGLPPARVETGEALR